MRLRRGVGESLNGHPFLEVKSMGKPLVMLLLVFWIFMAYRALQRGDLAMAALFGIVGVSLTVYRLRRSSSGS